MKPIKKKKCIECKEEFIPKTSLQKVCGYNCALIVGKRKAEEKANKERLKNEKFKNELVYEKSIKASLINTKTQVHAFIRERDKYKPCISCGTEWNNEFQCGHHYKNETFETLKFHLDNLHGQCKRCNLFLDGNFDNYALNLPNRIGLERYNYLVNLASKDKQHSKVWNLENLKEVRRLLKENKSYEITLNLTTPNNI